MFRNLDLRTTLRRNLKNYDADRGKLLVDQLFFYAAERKKRPWHVIVVVDQSGSMLDSAIFSAIMASIFYELPAVKTSLLLFDTQVVDVSDQVGLPVDVLLTIQLGGGTDITQALQYAAQLVREPARSIVVLITDFYEGRPEADLVRQVRQMAESGIRMIGLGALGYDAPAEYNRATAGKLRKVGMDVLVCTPEKLAESMAQNHSGLKLRMRRNLRGWFRSAPVDLAGLGTLVLEEGFCRHLRVATGPFGLCPASKSGQYWPPSARTRPTSRTSRCLHGVPCSPMQADRSGVEHP